MNEEAIKKQMADLQKQLDELKAKDVPKLTKNQVDLCQKMGIDQDKYLEALQQGKSIREMEAGDKAKNIYKLGSPPFFGAPVKYTTNLSLALRENGGAGSPLRHFGSYNEGEVWNGSTIEYKERTGKDLSKLNRA